MVPVAEEAGVRLALHPDDPPMPSLRGAHRLAYSLERYEQILDLNPQTVRTRFLRARRKLQERLQRELKLTFGDMLPFAGARCDRLIQRVLVLLGAEP